MTKHPLFKALIGALLLLYPVFVYFGLQSFSPRIVVLVLLLAAGLRWLIWDSDEANGYTLIAVGLVVVATLLSGSKLGLLLYPVMMSVSFFLIFVLSLFKPPTVVERIARKQEGELSDVAVLYTRRVTQVWSAFFLINASIALVTVFLPEHIWAFYNGFLSYVMMGIIMSCEYLVRSWYKAKYDV